jgi:serine/threonine-protein kinase
VGSLLVRSTPLGARVLVDGREYGRTPLTVGNLSRGAHSVRVIRDGYVADERQVTITSAQRAHSVTARLSPERAAPVVSATKPANPPAPPGVAPLTVESRPAGAKVFIDGRLVGTTPLVLPDVMVGEHALYLDHDGYQRWSSAIRIVTTERNRVTASLDR